MEGFQAHSAGKVGGAFDPLTFISQPKTLVRILSWVFAVVVLSCVANEGYVNRPDEVEEFCIFNRNQQACSSAIVIATLCFLCSSAFLLLDVYFHQISTVRDRKRAVLGDVMISAVWSLVWFLEFCVLANQWQNSKQEDNLLNEGADAARATVVFSFFSVFTWGGLALLSLERLKRVAFEEEYNKLFSPPLA